MRTTTQSKARLRPVFESMYAEVSRICGLLHGSKPVLGNVLLPQLGTLVAVVQQNALPLPLLEKAGNIALDIKTLSALIQNTPVSSSPYYRQLALEKCMDLLADLEPWQT